jgi:hypothetical protein
MYVRIVGGPLVQAFILKRVAMICVFGARDQPWSRQAKMSVAGVSVGLRPETERTDNSWAGGNTCRTIEG